jgi:hypothetical protein
MANCIHVVAFNGPVPVACNKPVFKKSHGWLCVGHLRAQQNSIPPAPRKPQPQWIGLQYLYASDEKIIADIISSDAKSIAAGTVRSVQFGSVEPIYLRYLER